MQTIQETFILDERYRNFVAGKVKNQRLYHTNENKEPSLFTTIIAFFLGIPIGVLIILGSIVIIISGLGNYYQYQVYGVETQATITECQRSTIYYRYEVNGQLYEGEENIETPCFDSLSAGETLRIRYLSYAPEQSTQTVWIPVALCFAVPVMVIMSSLVTYFILREAYYAKKTFQKFRRLRKGIVLEGSITERLFTRYTYGRGMTMQIPLIHYAFYSPDGTKLFGSRKLKRSDLTEENLPAEGTKIYVLYADDDCHMLL